MTFTAAQPSTPLGWAFRGSILVTPGSDQWTWIPDPVEPTPVFDPAGLRYPQSMAPQASGPWHHPQDATIAQQGFAHYGSQGTAFPGPNGVSPPESLHALHAPTHVGYSGATNAQLLRDLIDCIVRIDSITEDDQVQVPGEDTFSSRLRHVNRISDLWRSLKNILRSSGISQDDVFSRTIETGPPACHSIPLAMRPGWTALRGALMSLSVDTFVPNSIGMAPPDYRSVLRQEYAQLEQYLATTQQRYIGRASDNTNSRSASEDQNDISESDM